MPLFLLFLLVPLVEAVVLLRVMAFVGFLPTLILVLLTATIGFNLARHEGLKVLREVQSQSRAGIVPKEQLMEGFAILAAGLMLLFPGFLSDTLGFCLLIRPVRKAIIGGVRRGLKKKGWKEDSSSVEYEILD